LFGSQHNDTNHTNNNHKTMLSTLLSIPLANNDIYGVQNNNFNNPNVALPLAITSSSYNAPIAYANNVNDGNNVDKKLIMDKNGNCFILNVSNVNNGNSGVSSLSSLSIASVSPPSSTSSQPLFKSDNQVNNHNNNVLNINTKNNPVIIPMFISNFPSNVVPHLQSICPIVAQIQSSPHLPFHSLTNKQIINSSNYDNVSPIILNDGVSNINIIANNHSTPMVNKIADIGVYKNNDCNQDEDHDTNSDNNDNNDANNNTQDKCFECCVCGEQYDNKYNLKLHHKLHSCQHGNNIKNDNHDNNSHYCGNDINNDNDNNNNNDSKDIDSKTFIVYDDNANSMLNMNGITNVNNNAKNVLFPCYQCDATFKQFNSLKRHYRIHSNEKPYLCEFCHRSFTQSCTLQAHRRLHTGEKPYHCKFCLKSFRQSTNLRTHMKRLHPSEFQLLLNQNLISQNKKH